MTADHSAPAVLVACGHGTRSPRGRLAMAGIRARLQALRPRLEIAEAYVDVQDPRVGEVVAGLVAGGRSCVVVPLLLSTGFHVRVDVAAAVDAVSPAVRAGPVAIAARPLGPDPALVDVLLDRLAEAGATPADTVLLAAAGSSEPQATTDVDRVAADLATRLGRPVTACYLSATAPAIPDAVARACGGPRAVDGPRAGTVAVATFLLSPGRLADQVSQQARAAGARVVGRPLAGHPGVAALALRRYDEAVRAQRLRG